MGEICSSKNKPQRIRGKTFIKQFICHRIPERTFKIRGHYFPVCARCTGLYIGIFFYFFYACLFYVEHSINLTILGILLIIPTFIDGLTQLVMSRESNNIIRLFTGVLGGIGLMMFVLSIKMLMWW